MATVTSTTGWTGTPPTRSTGAANEMGALGVESEADRQKRTGVDRGGQGYVSGQVAPGSQPAGNASTALGALGVTPRPPASAAPQPLPGTAGTARGAPIPGAQPGDTTTRTSALSTGASPSPAPAPAPVPIAYAGAAPGAPAPGATAVGSTGTQNGYNPLGPVASNIPIIGGLTSTSEANLGPTIAAQNAAATEAGNLDTERYNYRPGAAPAQDRVALDTTNPDQIRAQQLSALQGLTAAANGTVPSAAELQLQQQAARNNAATLGQARALGGRSAGGAARAATLASSEANAQTNVAGAAQRAAEQANARQQLISALGGVRGQDTDISAANANLNQAANANNLNAQTTANQQADAWRQALLKGQLDALGTATTAAGHTVDVSKANADAENKSKGGALSTIGGAIGL